MAKFYSTRLLSLSSTNTMNNNGTLLERGSKPAVVNVPFHVFDEEDEAIATMRRPNDTFNSNGTFNSNHDSVEDGVCFESMRTRISNMTMIDAKHII
ncbi:hypothetical protein SPRG_20502 [Saprolegnia parasitica CBS 223.65]|uniref:Uncharacterized protein n=1 Tax=Saprolegnia parasitica (strain CBS 223.65) TaxID=695850 RepID=A0A067C8A7_SAPPC|nr:hypothetical protein SPRG_20502 [Saprolegnia parasitica CBS 223.65]KDO26703.1 hypothetical protein SPRG_20502 [Saprolegnia parasitica CBS 223.65]|eukprot:XP_012202591.1 hypothetical protein SPRG_20502 [Saprolegnia parasitica CBS 223.65]